jgi:RNA polymerase sigma-70 factor (sigma-E family)
MKTLAVARVDQAHSDFAEVYALHHAEALRLAYLLCGDRTRAEDAVADAFVKVYRQMQRTDVREPRAYIRRAVVNQINSGFRRLALERREAAKRSGDERGRRTSDEDIADHDEMFTALRSLPQRQRTVVVLRYYQDLPEKQIAEVMGVSVGTVKSTLHRALERLRSVLGEEVS